MSPEITQLILSMLQLNPAERLCLGEACYRSEARLSVQRVQRKSLFFIPFPRLFNMLSMLFSMLFEAVQEISRNFGADVTRGPPQCLGRALAPEHRRVSRGLCRVPRRVKHPGGEEVSPKAFSKEI